MEYFEEVASADSDRSKLQCAPHHEEVCARCCADFRLLNTVPYDTFYVGAASDEAARKARASTLVVEFYQQSAPMPVSPVGAIQQSPRLVPLTNGVLSNGPESRNPANGVMLLAYMTYTAHSHVIFQEKMNSILDFVIQSYPKLQAEQLKVVYKETKARLKQEAKREKAQMKETREKGVDTMLSKAQNQMCLCLNEIVMLLNTAGASHKGTFIETFFQLLDRCENSSGALGHPPVPQPDSNGNYDVSCLEPDIKWMEFLIHHGNNIPVDDPETWSGSRLLEFLQNHEIDPEPLPPREVLVKLAKHMKTFCFACYQIVDSFPDDKTAAAMGSVAMGTATAEDRAIMDQFYAPRKYPVFYIDPQIQSNLALSSLPKWPATRKVEQDFKLCRSLYTQKYGENRRAQLYNELLMTIESVAHVYDCMAANPGSDWLMKVQAEEDTVHNQTVAIRPVGVWVVGEVEASAIGISSAPVPIIAVEYLHARKVDGGASTIETFLAGTKENTTYLTVDACGIEETELFVKLLKENRSQLENDDEVVEKYEKIASDKGWSFSAIRAADPTKRGGALTCAVCDKRAPLTCSRCKECTYCSKECQVGNWKVHKKTCKKK